MSFNNVNFVDQLSDDDETQVPMTSSNLHVRKTAPVAQDANDANGAASERSLLVPNGDKKYGGKNGAMMVKDPNPILCGDSCQPMYVACNHTRLEVGGDWGKTFLFFTVVLLSNISYHFVYALIASLIDPTTSDVNRFVFALAVAGNLFAHIHAVGRHTGAYFNVWYSIGAAILYVLGRAIGTNPKANSSVGWELFKALPLGLGQLGGIVIAVLAILAPLGPTPAGFTYGGLVLGVDDFTSAAPGPLDIRNIFLITATVAVIEFMAYMYAHSKGGLFGSGLAGSFVITGTVFVQKLLFGPYTQGLTSTLFWLVTGWFRNVYPAWESMVFAPLVGVVIGVLLYLLFGCLSGYLCEANQYEVDDEKME